MINFVLLLNFGLSSQINRDFLTLKPVTVSSCSVTAAIVDVLSPDTGKTWMDRNLGGSQVATDSWDFLARGDLYQWGRLSDEHQCRNSPTTSTLSTSSTPGHGNFITVNSGPYDWIDFQDDNLWQGVGGVNNPCPMGYRVPTETEWSNEEVNFSSQDAAGAFGSFLKLTLAGHRGAPDGMLFMIGEGNYWTSTVSGTQADSCFSLTLPIVLL